MEEEKILYRKIHNVRIAIESIIGVIKKHGKNLSMSQGSAYDNKKFYRSVFREIEDAKKNYWPVFKLSDSFTSPPIFNDIYEPEFNSEIILEKLKNIITEMDSLVFVDQQSFDEFINKHKAIALSC